MKTDIEKRETLCFKRISLKYRYYLFYLSWEAQKEMPLANAISSAVSGEASGSRRDPEDVENKVICPSRARPVGDYRVVPLCLSPSTTRRLPCGFPDGGAAIEAGGHGQKLRFTAAVLGVCLSGWLEELVGHKISGREQSNSGALSITGLRPRKRGLPLTSVIVNQRKAHILPPPVTTAQLAGLSAM